MLASFVIFSPLVLFWNLLYNINNKGLKCILRNVKCCMLLTFEYLSTFFICHIFSNPTFLSALRKSSSFLFFINAYKLLLYPNFTSGFIKPPLQDHLNFVSFFTGFIQPSIILVQILLIHSILVTAVSFLKLMNANLAQLLAGLKCCWVVFRDGYPLFSKTMSVIGNFIPDAPERWSMQQSNR